VEATVTESTSSLTDLPRLTELPEWRALVEHAAELSETSLRELFDKDPERARRYTVEADGLYADFSKNRITDETLRLLVALAERVGLPERRRAMYEGAEVNVSEHRPALHVALRAPRDARIEVGGADVVAEVHETLDRMSALAEAIRSGQVAGATGKPVERVVNIGIGGSDLGPKVAYEALRRRVPRSFPAEFVSNIDPAEITSVFERSDPETTMFVVSSKTFKTPETLTNATTAKRWLQSRLPADADVTAHFAAVSNNERGAGEFGVPADRVFPVPEWVGGRYSYDSAVGFALMVGIGPDAFREMLAGARSIDEHFRDAPLDRNIPALMGLIGLWYDDFFDAGSYAVLPYSSELGSLPAHLQQLEMESNGKRVRVDGSAVPVDTAPVTWGQPGTNGQHAFYQMLHQGTRIIPADIIVVCRPAGTDEDVVQPHPMLVANAIAQSAALAFGKTADEVAADGTAPDLVPHRTFPGNRPSTTIVVDDLTPFTFGQLVTLYEHKTFTQGAVWGIDSFDQWGVELGKVLAPKVEQALADGGGQPGDDSSTEALVARVRKAVG
jgi:glucose-6-phosphate isomerase